YKGDHLIAALVRQVLDHRAGQDLGDLVRGPELGALPARLAMDADAQFHLVVGDLESDLARRRDDTLREGHAHAAAVGVHFLGQPGGFLQVVPGFGRPAHDFLQEDSDAHAATPSRVQAVLDRYVIVGDDGIDLGPFPTGQLGRHLEVHDVA